MRGVSGIVLLNILKESGAVKNQSLAIAVFRKGVPIMVRMSARSLEFEPCPIMKTLRGVKAASAAHAVACGQP
jgi:hypothetical protein